MKDTPKLHSLVGRGGRRADGCRRLLDGSKVPKSPEDRQRDNSTPFCLQTFSIPYKTKRPILQFRWLNRQQTNWIPRERRKMQKSQELSQTPAASSGALLYPQGGLAHMGEQLWNKQCCLLMWPAEYQAVTKAVFSFLSMSSPFRVFLLFK